MYRGPGSRVWRAEANNDGEGWHGQEISVLFTLATRMLKHHESEQGSQKFLLWQRWHSVSVASLNTPGCPLSPTTPSCFASW